MEMAAERLTRNLPPKPILLASLLAIGTVLLYLPVRHHEFLQFDDGPYVTKNLQVNTGLKLANIGWAFTASNEGHWHPLTWLSHMTDCQLFGLNPAAHHLVNLAIHTLNVLLLYLLLQRGTGFVWRSFLVAALFAVHPLNVENVAWVAERKSLLCALFSFLTILAYGWYVRGPNWKRYLLIVVAFALSLLSKAMAVSVPFVLLLLDYWPLERLVNAASLRNWTPLFLEKVPLFLMSLGCSIAAIFAARTGGSLVDASKLPLISRAQNAIVSYGWYITKLFWPAKLAVFYPHEQYPLPWFKVFASVAILGVVTLAVLYFRRARYLVTGWFLFVVTLIPVIGLVQSGLQAMADRYAYTAYIGLFIILTWCVSELLASRPRAQVVTALSTACVILALAVVTRRDLAYWQNGVKLLSRANEVAPRPDPVIEEALADALRSAGQYREAFPHYSKVCELSPSYAYCRYNMAEILYHYDQLQDALVQYQLAAKSTERKDLAVSCFVNSAEILLKLGDYPSADANLEAALQIDPADSTALRLRQQLLIQENHGPR